MSAIRPSTHTSPRLLSDQALIDAIEEGIAIGVNSERLEDLNIERLRRRQLQPLTPSEECERARRLQLEHERRIPVQLELEEVTS